MTENFICGTFATMVLVASIFADVTVNSSIALQAGKKSESSTESTVDKSFIRGEVKLAAVTEKDVNGLLHLRLQTDLSESRGVLTQVRQGYFTIPLPFISSQIGRWYEIYSPGKYFGPYLFGVNRLGSGSFKTNYTVVDGLMLSIPILEKAKTIFHAALLPETFDFEDTYAMFRVFSQPFDQFSLNLATNFHIVSEDDGVHRMVLTSEYSVLDNLSIFAEYAILDLSEVGENSWILAGIDLPTAGILNSLSVEFEIKQDRSEEYAPDFAWMILLGKKYRGISFDVAGGADPRGLGSENAADVGGYIRISSKF